MPGSPSSNGAPGRVIPELKGNGASGVSCGAARFFVESPL